WSSDSTTQELMAVVSACLHDLHDVPRAEGIFDRLCTKSSATLDMYLKSASRGDQEYWMDSLWEL
ncbi:hypothetical protein DFH09DRAFT_880132, partial [Mycena vulgaris]